MASSPERQLARGVAHMCGRFTSTWPSFEDLVRVLGLSGSAAVPTDVPTAFGAPYRPRWNVAPMNPHWVVRLAEAPARGASRGAGSEGPSPILAPAIWGLTAPPSGRAAPGDRPTRPLINARSETAARLPSFRGAFARRRCVVPVDGFYEWVGPRTARRPIWFHPAAEGVLRLAGLWEPAADDPAGALPTFTILTTAANDVVATAHDRMPVVLAAADVDTWLRGSPAEAGALLRPWPSDGLLATPVSPRANRVENDDPACLEPWAPTEGASPEAPPTTRAPAQPRARSAARKRPPASGPGSTLLLFGEESSGRDGVGAAGRARLR